jgi:hypothetical protein
MIIRTVQGAWILALGTVLFGCFGGEWIRGSGNVTTESRTVTGFTDIEISGSGKLIVEQGDSEALSITTDDNLMEYIAADVQGSKLTLGPKGLVSLRPSDSITYKLSVKNLKSVGISGDVTAEMTGIRTESLLVAVSGSGDIRISGTAEAQKIAVSGSANYEAEGFNTKDAAISISGSGKAVLAVSDNLDVRVSGSADVEYIGSPHVTESISGSGTVRRRT